MDDRDRLAIVSFEDKASKALNFMLMTEKNKIEAYNI